MDKQESFHLGRSLHPAIKSVPVELPIFTNVFYSPTSL